MSTHGNVYIHTHTVESLPILHLPTWLFWGLNLDGRVEFRKHDVRCKYTTLTSTGQETLPFWCYGPKIFWKHSQPLSAQDSGTGLEFLPRLHAQSLHKHPLGSPAPLSNCQEFSGSGRVALRPSLKEALQLHLNKSGNNPTSRAASLCLQLFITLLVSERLPCCLLS